VEKYCRGGQATDCNITSFMRIACWITKFTDTQIEYIICFPRQVWLCERASMLRYTYIACLVVNMTFWKPDHFCKCRIAPHSLQTTCSSVPRAALLTHQISRATLEQSCFKLSSNAPPSRVQLTHVSIMQSEHILLQLIKGTAACGRIVNTVTQV